MKNFVNFFPTFFFDTVVFSHGIFITSYFLLNILVDYLFIFIAVVVTIKHFAINKIVVMVVMISYFKLMTLFSIGNLRLRVKLQRAR